MIKEFFSKGIVRTVIETFIQGFLGALAVTIVNVDFSNKCVVVSILIGAIISGISACIEILKNRRGGKE